VATLLALLGRLDPDWRIRGRQWERLCVWYLTHDPGYRSQVRRVWLWSEWAGRCGVRTPGSAWCALEGGQMSYEGAEPAVAGQVPPPVLRKPP